MATPTESVQCFGRKKTAVAVTHCKRGRGLIKVNGVPIELIQPEILRYKAFEPILLLGRHRFAGVDMRIRVKGGGHMLCAVECLATAEAMFGNSRSYVQQNVWQQQKQCLATTATYDQLDCKGCFQISIGVQN